LGVGLREDSEQRSSLFAVAREALHAQIHELVGLRAANSGGRARIEGCAYPSVAVTVDDALDSVPGVGGVRRPAREEGALDRLLLAGAPELGPLRFGALAAPALRR